jgi:hypothetical protein
MANFFDPQKVSRVFTGSEFTQDSDFDDYTWRIIRDGRITRTIVRVETCEEMTVSVYILPATSPIEDEHGGMQNTAIATLKLGHVESMEYAGDYVEFTAYKLPGIARSARALRIYKNGFASEQAV